MKNMIKILCGACLLMGVMNVVSCSKYEGPDVSEKTPGTLVSTSWGYEDNDSITVVNDDGDEVKVDYTTTYYMLFQTATVGVAKTEISSRMVPELMYDTIFEFKYSYQMPGGSLTYAALDDFGHETTEEASFTVDGVRLTIDWPKAGTATYYRR